MSKTVVMTLLALVMTACNQVPQSPATFATKHSTVNLRILAINDLHGNLLPSKEKIRVRTESGESEIEAGGVERLATKIKYLKEAHRNSIVVAAGDLIGASPFLSSIFHDEPTIQSLDLMGLELSAVGNHEFDEGVAELLRKQNGGCHANGCVSETQPFKGAKFKYLAASTKDVETGRVLLDGYSIKTFDGVPVAFIGLTLKGTPGLVMKDKVAGWAFFDEAETINNLTEELHGRGIKAIVVLIHEGGYPSTGDDRNRCVQGPIVDIAKRIDKRVDLIISGHTHREYNCIVDGLPITSAHRYGTYITSVDILLDAHSKDVIKTNAENHLISLDISKDADQTKLIDFYKPLADPISNRVIGSLSQDFVMNPSSQIGSPLGQLIADANLFSTKATKSQIAFVNSGGIRAPLVHNSRKELTYGTLFEVQPFRNSLVTKTFTGHQLIKLLEQQWLNRNGRGLFLEISKGFEYQWDERRPLGSRILVDSVRVNGERIHLDKSYRVTANAFLADGGDGFHMFKEGKDAVVGITDLQSLEEYIISKPDLSANTLNRIQHVSYN